MVKEKVDTEFCGLSDEEKKLIKEKEEDILLDLAIKYFGYENIYEVFNDYGLIAILEVLREHLPFIKEQETKIMNKYEEQRFHTTDYVIRDFIDYLNDVFFSLQIDVENINSKFFERIKNLPKESYKSLVYNVFGMFINMLCEKDTEEKVEIMKLFSQNREGVEDQGDKDIQKDKRIHTILLTKPN